MTASASIMPERIIWNEMAVNMINWHKIPPVKIWTAIVSAIVTLVCTGTAWAGNPEIIPGPPGPLVQVTEAAKIWDMEKKEKGPSWSAFPAYMKNKDSWRLIPREKTDYIPKGDVIIENKYFYICFNAFHQDALHVKADDRTLWQNIQYECHYPDKIEIGGVKEYLGGEKSVRIVKNTPDEVIVEHRGTADRRKYPMVFAYRIFKDKPWVQALAVEKTGMLGIHGKVRIGLAVPEEGNDYVVDSLRDPKNCYVPPLQKGKLIICFYESGVNPFMWVLTFPSFERANTYFNCDSGPKGDTMWWGGTAGYPKNSPGCLTATYSRFGNQKEPVVEGALAYWHNWHRDDVDRSIKKGETYTSTWKPPYPGKWRMTARVAEKKYNQGFNYDGKTKFPASYFSKDVFDGVFTITSAIDGHLDYVIMYMYDRTKDTPPDVYTPMDQYRWTIQNAEVRP